MKQKISIYAKKLGLSYMTIWRMVKNNQLKYEKLPTGTILITEDFIENKIKEKSVILYARVSSSENKDNLEKQLQRLTDFACAKGWKIKHAVKEIGSGLNDNRQQLLNILDKDNFDILLVEHKDRLARFGTKIIEKLLNKLNKTLFIINDKEENTHEDLMQDFVSIITSFTARLYGLRRSKRKTEKLIEELKNNENK